MNTIPLSAGRSVFHTAWKLTLLISFSVVLATASFALWNRKDLVTCATMDLNGAYRSRRPLTVTDVSGDSRVLQGEPWLELTEVPPALINALVSAEDQRFWQRSSGIDCRAVLRAIYSYACGRTEGASTLQMQAARSGFDLPGGKFERSLRRKVYEAIVATRLARTFTREQTLEIYLNCANFAGEQGLRAAARKHFNCAPRNLSAAARLWLISTLPSPQRRAKEAGTPQAAERARALAHKCLDRGRCTRADLGLDEAEQVLTFREGRRTPALAQGLLSEVKRNFSDEAWCRLITLGGGDVEVTLDFALQKRLQETLSAEIAAIAPRLMPSAPAELKAAFVVLDPDTGAVLACIGSRNPGDEYSGATMAQREPGSTLKTLELAAAREADTARLDTLVEDEPLAPGTFPGMPVGRLRWPANADGQYLGQMTLREAFARSRNPVFIALGEANRSGLDRLLREMHVGSVAPNNPGQFIVGSKVTLIEWTAAYASFVTGVWNKPYLIAAVHGATGAEISSVDHESRRVVSPETAADVCTAMRGVMDFGTARSLNSLPGAGKTGTTSGSDGRGRARDLRFQYLERGTAERRAIAVGLWVGADKGSLENPNATSHDILAVAGKLINIVRRSAATVRPRPALKMSAAR